MEEELSLKEVQEIELEILKHLDTFCRENNIKYFLSYGTLLGAVRHKGFIPWDDDIDVSMMREDYERFRKIYDGAGTQFHLWDPQKDRRYLYPILKLENKNTIVQERNATFAGVEMGVNIDIFPLDYVDDDERILDIQQKKLNKLRSLVSFALHKEHESNGAKGMIVSGLDRVISLTGRYRFTQMLMKKAQRYRKKQSTNVSLIAWIYKEPVHSANEFQSASSIEFEKSIFQAPQNPDEYLRREYGDYMVLPPVEKQVRYHGFKAYRINKEK